MLGYRPDGKRDRRRVYGATQGEVDKKLRALRQQHEQGTLPTQEQARQTVAGYLQHWLSTAADGIRPSSKQRDEQIVRLHLLPTLGRYKLADLRPDHLRDLYKDKKSPRDKDAPALSPATIIKIHGVIRRALQQALRDGAVPRNVADAVQRPTVPKPKLTIPTPEEARRLFESSRAAGDDLAALWPVAAMTGCRLGELLALCWDAIDFDARTLTVRHTLFGADADYAPVFGDPKTESGRRTIRLGAETLRILREHRQQQLETRLRVGEGYAAHDLVFSTRLGRPLGKRNVTRAYKTALKRAGLPEAVRFHDLRHFAATTARRAGVDLKTVSERLGHADPRITATLYQHAVPELDADAADRLERAVLGE